MYLSLRMKLTKADRIVESTQIDWLKIHIYFNTNKRKNAANGFEKDFLN